MKIKKIKLENNEILGDLTLDFTNPQTGEVFDTIILAGENGVGKSTIMNIIYEMTDLSNFRINTKESEKSERREFVFELNALDKASLKRIFENLKPFEVEEIDNELIYKIDYFNGQKSGKLSIVKNAVEKNIGMISFSSIFEENLFRTIFSDVEINFTPKQISTVTSTDIDQKRGPRIKSSSDLASEITQLFIDIQNLDNDYFVEWHKNNISEKVNYEKMEVRLSRFKKAFGYMFENKNYSKIKTENGSKKVIFEEFGKEIPIEKLSSGEKQIVFRGSFLLKDQQIIKGAIVLIDEPEISLHPKWQLKILDFYKNLLKDENNEQTSQLIISTHSPFILHNENRMNDKCIIFSRDHNGKVMVDNDGAFFGWTHEKTIEKAFNIDINFGKKPTIITEGKTDWKHLKKALEQLQKKGKFKDMDVTFYENEENMGDSRLFKICKQAVASSTNPQIYIFDRDNTKILHDIKEKDKNYKDWKRNVYSFPIPVPSHRMDNPEVSIELYYSDEEIKQKDENGRRLYYSTEFHSKSGKHLQDNKLSCTDSKFYQDRLVIIDNQVYGSEHKNVALSKNDFADNISKDIAPFDNFDFGEFEKIFDIISEIITKSKEKHMKD